MKLYHAIRWGNDDSPDGPNGDDTHFIVRAKDRTQAARLVDLHLLQKLTHKRVEPRCNVLVEIGKDTRTTIKPQILLGPLFGITGGITDGYNQWLREAQTDYKWVEVDKLYPEWRKGLT